MTGIQHEGSVWNRRSKDQFLLGIGLGIQRSLLFFDILLPGMGYPGAVWPIPTHLI